MWEEYRRKTNGSEMWGVWRLIGKYFLKKICLKFWHQNKNSWHTILTK